MKKNARPAVGILLTLCLLATPLTAFAKKGEKNFNKGLQYEAAQQWERAAQEFTLAVAANPSDTDYQLHYRRAIFNASMSFMQKGRALAEQQDYIGAYNAFRQAYAYDPVNQLALSEMERMQRLQREKTGDAANGAGGTTNEAGKSVSIRQTSYEQNGQGQGRRPPVNDNAAPESVPLRIINYNSDLKALIRQLADQLGLNVIFDSQSFRQPRTVEINLKDVTTAQALDWVFLQEGLFFQKLSRRTVLVADQNRRPQYQQLVIRTFYLSNTDPNDARQIITQAIPPQQGRPQTIVIPDKSTNSLTVRDTAENVLLIADILKSLDKDRAEVVMDVNIYEVSNSDLLQLGNQVGTDASLTTLGGFQSAAATFNGLTRAIVGAGTTAAVLPSSFGAALILPQSSLSALQSKNHTRLVASTQVHAFNGEESSARIGQRVPVQTAQTYPYGVTTPTNGTGGTGGTTSGIFNGGFPVIQYEPTGLTLKFTPQVFPNQDVQVKMSIESKDVQGASSLTPTFTERTITGTARIQNNRTMMLASVAQDKQSNGRSGIPLLGLIPILGRFVTAPRRDNVQTDIVIAVTPRVLRAPAITPNDEELRPSGTLSTPTTGSLEALVQEANREDQLAAARKVPTNSVVQLPDVEVAGYVPAPKSMIDSPAATPSTEAGNVANALARILPVSIGPSTSSSLANTLASSLGQPAKNVLPTSGDISAKADPEASALLKAATAAGVIEPLKSPEALLNQAINPAAVAEISDDGGEPPMIGVPNNFSEVMLMAEKGEFKVGEKQRIALVLSSSTVLTPAIFKIKFDPKVLSVKGVSRAGTDSTGAPGVMHSIDPAGYVMAAVTPLNGTVLKAGSNIVLYLEVEAVGAGTTAMTFDKENVHLMGANGREVAVQFDESHLVVK
jgi:general secretion pathway protein D